MCARPPIKMTVLLNNLHGGTQKRQRKKEERKINLERGKNQYVSHSFL